MAADSGDFLTFSRHPSQRAHGQRRFVGPDIRLVPRGGSDSSVRGSHVHQGVFIFYSCPQLPHGPSQGNLRVNAWSLLGSHTLPGDSGFLPSQGLQSRVGGWGWGEGVLRPWCPPPGGWCDTVSSSRTQNPEVLPLSTDIPAWASRSCGRLASPPPQVGAQPNSKTGEPQLPRKEGLQTARTGGNGTHTGEYFGISWAALL